MLVALIDDIALYKAVHSASKKDWYYVPSSGTALIPMDSWAEARAYKKEQGQGELVYYEYDKGFKSCKFAFKQLIDRIKADTKCDDYLILLSSRERKSFRYELATISPYKANRPPKPRYYDELYEYVLNNYQCLVSRNSREVDDELGIIQTSKRHPHTFEEIDTIICTLDKDLLQIPGKQYNLDSRILFNVKREGSLVIRNKQLKGTGLKWFYAQMLLGDTIDTVPGIPARMIPGEPRLAAQRIYDGLAGTLEQCEQFVYTCYKAQYGDKAKEAMTEIGRLLYMLTCEDTELWSPKWIIK